MSLVFLLPARLISVLACTMAIATIALGQQSSTPYELQPYQGYNPMALSRVKTGSKSTNAAATLPRVGQVEPKYKFDRSPGYSPTKTSKANADAGPARLPFVGGFTPKYPLDSGGYNPMSGGHRLFDPKQSAARLPAVGEIEAKYDVGSKSDYNPMSISKNQRDGKPKLEFLRASTTAKGRPLTAAPASARLPKVAPTDSAIAAPPVEKLRFMEQTKGRHFGNGDALTAQEASDVTIEEISDAPESLPEELPAPESEQIVEPSSPPIASVNPIQQPRDAGADPNQFQFVSQQDVLRHAFSHSPVLKPLGIRILRNPAAVATIYDRSISASDPFFGPDAALAEFDSILTSSINAQNNDRVFNNAILGGDALELTQDLINMNAGVQQRARNGGVWDFTVQTLYDNNNRAGNLFPNYWETQFVAGVRQPLLRGAGREFNEIAGPNAQPGFNFSNGIIIAQLNTQISGIDFCIALHEYVRDLHLTYWELVRHYQTYQDVVAARDLAYRTWQSTRAKLESKLVGADKEAQARARYYRYVREVQIALGGSAGRPGLYQAERQLRQMIGLPIIDQNLLKPVETPSIAKHVFEYDETVSTALASRPELRRQETKVQQQRLRLVAAKNFLLPQLDLIGRYRIRGFGDDLAGGDTRFASAGRDFRSMDHQELEFGIEMGVVQGRRQARAAVRNAQLQLTKEQALLLEQNRAVEQEIGDAVAEVSSSYLAMQTSTQQVEAAMDRLEASQAVFEMDKIQIEFLLEAQEELLITQQQLAADQLRYATSLVNLNYVTGRLLCESGVHVSTHKCGVSVSPTKRTAVGGQAQ